MKLSMQLFVLLLASTLFAGTETETLYLSGKGSDATVEWDFMVTGGRRANVWSKIPVPSNWELQGFGTYNYGHDKKKADEKGLYRHRFTVSQRWSNRRIFIVFEGSMTDTEVRINGQLAGSIHQGAFYRFKYEITNLVRVGLENLLEVTVNKMSSNQSVNFAERQSDFWVFGGIFRPVYLQAVPMQYIDWTAIDARANGDFQVKVYIGGSGRADHIEAQIRTLNGLPLGQPFSGKLNAKMPILLHTHVSGQKNWTAESPNLYYVDLKLMQGEKAIHIMRERFAFRTIEVREGEGIFLNGSRIVLRGCDRHSFWPTTGRALNRNRCRDDILTMKEMNMNAVRMSHYPPDSYFLDLCDELGLYVLDELAGWQKPPYDTQIGEKLVAEMVKRDVNHPCILFWDNGNEGGWNTDLDDDFSIYDPQNRRVLHPWELHGGVDTDHYESYESVQHKLQSGNIFMPTETLHGLYDGGLGSGLDDYWKLMWGKPLTGGMFLWVFADEGVVRTDQNCRIDTDGNHAPDGILGPFHQREASFYTIKEVWSPVYIESTNMLPTNFNGRIPLENRYDFTNLSRCHFEWRLVRYVNPADRTTGARTLTRGKTQGPDLAPHQKGSLQIDLPPNWRDADALFLTAFDSKNRELFTWRWKIAPASKIINRFFSSGEAAPDIRKNRETLEVVTRGTTFIFNRKSGMLEKVQQGDHNISFGNGPIFVASGMKNKAAKAKLQISKIENGIQLLVANHPTFEHLQWTVYGSGWLKLDYSYSHQGAVDYMGVSFDYPDRRMNEMTWLGKGPYRVWKNRLKGQTIDVWHNDYKNFKVNTAWDYPVFPGYYANFNWVVFRTDDGPITIATDDDDLFMRVYSQKDGDHPRHTKMIWPPGDISFLHAIPAIGTKFKDADQYGPQSQKFQAQGTYAATLYFYFGVPMKQSKLSRNTARNDKCLHNSRIILN